MIRIETKITNKGIVDIYSINEFLDGADAEHEGKIIYRYEKDDCIIIEVLRDK